MNYVEFSSIIKQAKVIAYAYKAIGLYSTLLLTVATVISMTNVFTRGQFSTWPNVGTIWALVFSTAIEVNILRMFIDAYIERSRTAFTIGMGLGFVAGASLLIEGLQQSIGLNWDAVAIKIIIGILIGLRVVFVIVLLAREGTKLAMLIVNTLEQAEQPAHESEQQTSEQPALAASEQVGVSSEQQSEHPQVNSSPRQKRTAKVVNIADKANKNERVRQVLSEHPNASVTDIVNSAKVSRGYASEVRSQVLSEQQKQIAQ